MIRLLAIVSAMVLLAGLVTASAPAISGQYIEVRSNHVYTCGCLYSGEQVTSGREAILAWVVREGAYAGQDLSGARAVAVLTGPESLSLQGTPRRSAVFVDGVPAAAQKALVDMLKEYYGDVLGQIISVQAAPVKLAQEGERITIEVAGLSRVVVRPARLPEDAHQGSWLWYTPFIPTTDSALCTTEFTSFRGDHFARRWWEADAGITGYIASFRVPR
ncbi:MAG: DUF1326 domain-containing protein [Bryobacterales bacterium]|nr:DUF1326 domain-containing protein [Bryobacteraceae bacterium]MDW8130811.1 DUF1326 domain-containing protein [Bryobacterales bacterium]